MDGSAQNHRKDDIFCADTKMFGPGGPNWIPRLGPWAGLPDLIKILFEPAGPNTKTRFLQATAARYGASWTKMVPNGPNNGPELTKAVATLIWRFCCKTNGKWRILVKMVPNCVTKQSKISAKAQSLYNKLKDYIKFKFRRKGSGFQGPTN